VNGPEHYREGERLLERCAEMIESTDPRANVAIEAQAHFLAALFALHASEKEPESIAWQEAADR